QLTTTNARLRAQVNPQGWPTAAWFEWGTDTHYGNLIGMQDVGQGSSVSTLNVVLNGLVIGTEYHFRALATNAFGVTAGLDQTFNLNSQRPGVTSLAVDQLSNTSARFRGQVNPHGWPTAAWFEWGTDTNYGNVIGMQEVGQGSSVLDLNVVLGALRMGPNYHYRLAATNAFGAVYGADQSFILSFMLTDFANFETAPVHPIALGPDGQTLVVCNLPDNRLEIFDVSGGLPIPTGSVPVGLDPVTVRFASSNELWVVNHISSTVNIIDLTSLNVIATLHTPAGPSDVVFAGNPRRAWISCSRTNSVLVVDPTTRAAVANIAIDGERPRAMATSPDGTKVYVAIFESGNGSTLLGRRLTELGVQPRPGPLDDSNGPYAGADPPPNSGTAVSPPINPALTVLPPRVSHIVRKNASGRWMDDNNADWTEWVSGTNASISGRIQGWDLPDRDLAVIDTATLQVTYARRLMNICMAVAVNPASGQIAVVGTDAMNERRFEPNLKGVFLRVNLALVDPVTLTHRIRDLNPHLDYITRSLPPAQRALALGDPRGIEWNAAGTRAYVTGMGSRNLLVIDADGARVNSQPIDLGEGPTGIALDEARLRLYVWNRFSSTISVVDTEAGTVITNISVFDPTPDIVRKGRRHLYDTRANSGLGIVACGSCHVDARMDRLAWDLGDPAGERATNGFFTFHPMKGPMLTQTLQDIITPTNFNRRQLPLHWRADRTNIEAFNVTFPALLARDTQLTSNEMAEFKGMLQSISFPPNYLRTFSNTLPTSVALPGLFGRTNTGVRQPLPAGDAQAGLSPFIVNCGFCHTFNLGTGGGASNQVLSLPRAGTEGAFKTSQLRNLLDRLGMDALSTNGRTGFGFMHDGRVDSLTHFLNAGFPQTAPNDTNVANLVAFMLCFSGSDFGQVTTISPSQDVPSSAGKQVTFAPSAPPQLVTDMFNLAIRDDSRLEFIVRGKKNGLMRNWLLRRATADFQSDRHGEIAATLNDIFAGATSEFTAMLVPQYTGWRLALDRDEDGYLNVSESEAGSDPADPSSYPGRILRIAKAGSDILLSWQSVPGVKYTVQWRTNWPPATWLDAVPRVTSSLPITVWTDSPPATDPRRYYRLRTDP
ncbi:MAG TPA: beta-propeller fold lactonase family protein, partial [Verrucomicrobiae bacterium]|nr:beta-propeller fold lactonase family protein [Verrucomicrobiae bacterium]